MTTEYKRKFLIDVAFYGVILAIIYLLFKFMSANLLPFIIGIAVSFIVQRPVRFINSKTKIPKSVTTVVLVVLTYFLILSIVILLCYWLYSWIYGLTKLLPGILPSISSALNSLSIFFSNMIKNVPQAIITSLEDIPGNAVSSITSFLTSALSSAATKIAAGTPAFLISTIVTVVASCYIAKDYDTIIKFASQYTPKKVWSFILEIKDLFTKTIFRLLRGYALIMLITFIELAVGLTLIGQNNSVMLAAIICIIDILPVLGTGAVVIPWALISLLTGNVLKAVFLLVLYVVITIVRNFIEPKIIGEQVGLHPLIALLSIFVGYRLIGFTGIFIFPLILIVIFDLYKKGKITIFKKANPNDVKSITDK